MGGTDQGSCGCCAGLDAETPVPIVNPPGLSSIGYRAGTHARFKESLLARLSDPGLPALAGLTTREDDDLTIALCDALAMTLDVLTFYQERIANENLLRTATERRSVLELARLIGYELAPGVAASTHLAFTLQEVPGSPELAAGPVEVPVGSRVQSVPGPGEQPQTFETVEVVEARSEWNAIPVQASVPWRPRVGDRQLWLSGIGHNVGPGDSILIVGQERIDDPSSKRWDVQLLTSVEEDRITQRTRLAWDDPLGSTSPPAEPAATGVAVYVLRQRAALFGHNAPDARMLSLSGTNLRQISTGSDWKNFHVTGDVIDLDAGYPRIVPGSWLVLIAAAAAAVRIPRRRATLTSPPAETPASPGHTDLYRVTSLEHLTRRDFGLSARTTRIHPDTTAGLTTFGLRLTTVLAQSEVLPVAETPLEFPLFGSTLALGRPAPGLSTGRALAVSGKRARVRLRAGRPAITMPLDAGGAVTVDEGDSLRLAAAPERKVSGQWAVLTPVQFGKCLAAPGQIELRLRLVDRDDRIGTLVVPAAALELAAASAEDGQVAEIVHVGDLPASVTHDRDRTTFALSSALRHCYDRPTVAVNANVARATHGETTAEVLGSGDARISGAGFLLRRSPLTFVSAATPSGRLSTLAVRANDLLWAEVDSLYAQGPLERAYEVAIDADARATVRFGDGVEGARLPSGDHNVRATYRLGLGLGGNVAAGKLTILLSRPLGVTGAFNPEAAGGGEDPETEARARENAPLTILTLDRAVSVRDYQNFARAFAGIAKAHALWVPSGAHRGVFLTVAGEQGAAVKAGGDTHTFLQAALRRYGDPLVPLHLESYRDVPFHLRLSVKVAADSDAAVVLPAVEAAVRDTFGFEARALGQAVSVDEATAVAQAVTGVEAVNVTELRRSDTPIPALRPRIFALLPQATLTASPLPAELLTIEAAAIVMDLMP